MFFLVLATDRPGTLDQRLAKRPRHLDYWAALPDPVKLAGAMLDGDTPKGSVFLIEAEDMEAARALIAADPFMTDGVFDADVRVEPIRPSIGEWLPS